ncbi:condensation domain-containing protein [Rhodococcoides kyotonense]|uniref:Phosphopantetheine attachment site n=1 Tax=Rhodococcoides kyotonense TaxID=398843 RepID=A0A239N514_9NOCA|nr:condensation domain-containing protein [Rhodococcus kyotonensis]SNT49268.1 Phosphopantetheine attachment site [Rhodococcus kyotonensis]
MSESSIRSLSKRYEDQRSSRVPGQGASRVPLSLAQQAAIRAERALGPSLSHDTVVWEIVPAPDRERLESACTQVLENVEILRTVYPADRRMPYQKVVDTPAPFIEYVDEPYVPGGAASSFDLETQVPIRVRVHPSAVGAVLELTIHRVAGDLKSAFLVAEAIVRAYNSDFETEQVAQYRDFSADQIKASATDDADLAYWVENLAGVPTRFLALAATARASEHLWYPIPGGLSPAADDPTASVLAATAIALHREWGITDIAIGVLDAIRDARHDAVVGHFANQLVCRVTLDGTRTPREVLALAADRIESARTHASTRIERVGVMVSEESRTRGTTPFQVAVQIDTVGPIPLNLNGHHVASVERRTGVPAGVDLAVVLRSEDDGWSVSVGMTPALCGVDDIAGFMHRLGEAIGTIDSDTAIGVLPESPARAAARLSVVHGCAVDLAHVEAVLNAVEGVAPGVVEVRDSADGPRLDAYVTGDAAAALAAHDSLRHRLPSVAVPATVTGLDRLPLTASGEIDREALLEPTVERQSGFGGPARTGTEETVVAALRVVLSLGDDVSIGREDSFFGLGGDSLAALRLVSQLKDAGFVVEPHTVFVHPAVAELAEQLDHPTVEPTTTPDAVAPMAASGLDEAALAALRARLSSR